VQIQFLEPSDWPDCGSTGKMQSRNLLLETAWQQSSFSIPSHLIHLSIIFKRILLLNSLTLASSYEAENRKRRLIGVENLKIRLGSNFQPVT
jgi:hypothetical protein